MENMETPGHAALAGAEASSLGGTTPTAVTGSTPFKSFQSSKYCCATFFETWTVNFYTIHHINSYRLQTNIKQRQNTGVVSNSFEGVPQKAPGIASPFELSPVCNFVVLLLLKTGVTRCEQDYSELQNYSTRM